MPGLFDVPRVAAGYARARPPFHRLVADRLRDVFEIRGKLERALDVGCGTGLSTAALEPLARYTFGIDPSTAMLQWASALAPRADFAAGAGENLPFRAGSFELVTAGGALDWIAPEPFLAEVSRVLTPSGALAVYDIGDGCRFRDSGALGNWYGTFLERYPKPARRAVTLDTLRPERFDLGPLARQEFEAAFPWSLELYLDYLMTQSNVTEALNHGGTEAGIRAWCAEGLGPLFAGTRREILFAGYILCFRRSA
jgi:SAM-dependent methyltransferase